MVYDPLNWLFSTSLPEWIPTTFFELSSYTIPPLSPFLLEYVENIIFDMV